MSATEDILVHIEAALDTSRPYLRDDGGNVEIVELDDEMTLKIRLIGSCGTCPQSYMTFKSGIETVILQQVPEVKKIIPVNFFPEHDTFWQIERILRS